VGAPANSGTPSGAAAPSTTATGITPAIMREQVKRLDRSLEAIQGFYQSGTPPKSWDAVIGELQGVRGYVVQFQDHLQAELGTGGTGMSGSA